MMHYQKPLTSQVSGNAVLVIGAGLSGTFSALEAAKRGYQVFLIDQGNDIIPNESSSYNECYKLHTGLHYAGNVKTAVKCLEDSVAFARLIPADCLAGSDQVNEPWRRGRHFIMSNSLFPPEEIKQVALLLQKRYAQLVKEDLKNKVFGEPQDFIKFLSESEYPHVSKNIPFFDPSNLKRQYTKVVLGIESGESQIDIEKLKAYLTKEIKKNPLITFIPYTKVIHLSHLPNQLGYAVTVTSKATATDKASTETWRVPAIINCAWQNIENLSKQLGFYKPDENRVIRVKVCIRVKLPQSLQQINTCIFSIGPFVSITNLGNGEAVLASETTTNVGFYKAGTDNVPSALAELAKTPLNPYTGKGAYFTEKILTECAYYLPELSQARPLKVMMGYVKMVNMPTPYHGLSSLYQQHSPIHQRLERGVEVESGALGYIANSGNKMTYTLKNAEEACNILDAHFRLRNRLNHFITCIKPLVQKELNKFGKRYEDHLTDPIIFAICKRAFLSNSSETLDPISSKTFDPAIVLKDIFLAIEKKEMALALIRNSHRNTTVAREIPGSSTEAPRFTAKL